MHAALARLGVHDAHSARLASRGTRCVDAADAATVAELLAAHSVGCVLQGVDGTTARVLTPPGVWPHTFALCKETVSAAPGVPGHVEALLVPCFLVSGSAPPSGPLAKARGAGDADSFCCCLPLSDAVTVLVGLGVEAFDDLPLPGWWAAAGPTCDAERVDYNHLSRRAYAVLATHKRWYIGFYADRGSAEAAGTSFLSEMRRAQSNDAFAKASLAQKAARDACLGRVGFEQWRNDSAAGRQRELNANWQPHDVPRGQNASKKKFLGSFRTEMAARVALDTFLSLLQDTSVSSSHTETELAAAVAAAKLVAAEETSRGDAFDAPEQLPHIAACTGWIPERKKLRISFAGKPYELGRFTSADAARPASLLFLQARATKDLAKVQYAVEECLRMSAENFTNSCQPSASAETAPASDGCDGMDLLAAVAAATFDESSAQSPRVGSAHVVGGGDEAQGDTYDWAYARRD